VKRLKLEPTMGWCALSLIFLATAGEYWPENPLRFQRIPQPVAEIEVWARGQKFSWTRPTGHRRGRKKVEKW